MKLIYGVLSSALLIAAGSSCSDDYNPGGGTSGKINPQLDLDVNAITSRSTSAGRDASPVSVNDLKLRLSSTDGSFVKEWNSIADFDNNELFKVGTYTLEAIYGDVEDEGFEKPYYYASTQLTVKENKVTQVSMNAQLSNSMVSIATTEAFRSYFTNYSFQAHAEGGDYVNFTSTETRPGYLRPGKVTVTADVTKPNGLSATLEAAVFVAEPKHHYTVTVDVNNGQAGDAQLVITYDDMLSQEDVYIDLSDEILSAPAPAVIAQGFEAGTTATVIEGSSDAAAPAFFINAEGGIKSVVLSTRSTSLIEQGWYNEIDLAAATPAQQSKLKSLGLDVKGLFGNIGQMAQIDLSGVLSHIRYLEGSDNVSEFTVVAKDNYSKVSDPLTFSVKVEPIVIGLSEDVTPSVGASTMTVALNYNGTDVARNVKIQYKNLRGTWSDATITKVTEVSDNNYIVEIDGIPADDTTVTLRAVAAGKESDEVTIAKGGFTIASTANDMFATRARIVPTYFDDDLEAAASSVKYEISEDGSNFTAVSHTMESDGSSWLAGLPSGKNLTVKATINGKIAKTEITTEEEWDIPNGNLDADVSIDGSASNWENIVFSGWGTNNAMTTSQGNNNAYSRISGTIQTDDSHSGKAALIRTVGWGSGNSAWGSSGSSGSTKYTDAGLLHLGATRTTRPDGYGNREGSVETSDLAPLGISCTSRPSSMTFYYKYSPKNSADLGYAEICVIDAAGNIITSKSVSLSASSAYQQRDINLDYPVDAAKAAKIYVRFQSTNDRTYLQKNDDNFSGPGFANTTRGTFMGSQLYIDDIKLNY